MKEYKDYLTNEKLNQKFKSQFELVNYAINLAGNMIRTGRGARVKTDSDNPAMQVLEEISEGKDQLEEISFEEDETTPNNMEVKEESMGKMAETRRMRKILS